MAEKKASDIFVSVGAPINIKIQAIRCRSTSHHGCGDQRMAYEMLTKSR
jgi:Tfp pilus assembly ATPase PilU